MILYALTNRADHEVATLYKQQVKRIKELEEEVKLLTLRK